MPVLSAARCISSMGRPHNRARCPRGAPQHHLTERRAAVVVGNGTLLMSLLALGPGLEGICVDRPSVCARAAARLAKAPDRSLADRIRFQPADTFEEVPEGGRLYLLKNVLYDWSPEQGTCILTAVRRAMNRTAHAFARTGPRPRLIVLEPLLDGESGGAHALSQMVLGGKKARGFRTADGIWQLHTAAGLKPLSVTQLSDGHHAFESGCTRLIRPSAKRLRASPISARMRAARWMPRPGPRRLPMGFSAR
ncbi:methyltransferase [Streptomyces sp. NPDC057496]|uniref:methyltransferase n=1 Tax=Streptomyces sp. NPDC057496 TaxID=3346149 RepID=UPI0036991CFF